MVDRARHEPELQSHRKKNVKSSAYFLLDESAIGRDGGMAGRSAIHGRAWRLRDVHRSSESGDGSGRGVAQGGAKARMA